MLSKINKIKNLGLLFGDFVWKAEVPAFNQVNLIYGWNGSGKTTLTRLFDEVLQPSDMAIEFELELADGTCIRRGQEFPHQVRIFNHDYIQRNVHLVESKANGISVLLGEENNELVAEIENKERDLDNRRRGLRELEQTREAKEKENEDAFSNVARTIGAAIVGSGVASRTYRSPDAKRDFAALSSPTSLDQEQLDASILALKQDPLGSLTPLQIPTDETAGTEQGLTDALSTLRSEAEGLCARTVEGELIERLRTHSDIAQWVEQGLGLHAKHQSAECEYCGSPITAERMTRLAKHFSESDQRLKNAIETSVGRLRRLFSNIQDLRVHDSARLYTELQPSYEAAKSTFEEERNDLLRELTDLAHELKAKKDKTAERLALKAAIDATALVEAVHALNRILEAHNKKSDEFREVQAEAVKKIKAHYLSTIHATIVQNNTFIEQAADQIRIHGGEIERLRREIDDTRARISSPHRACAQINDALRAYLGRGELRFEPEDELSADASSAAGAAAYRILRGDRPATHLSEGEKTAIAFVYFVVHLSDGQFSKADGIVFVDDPISSLDSNSLYQAFSFLKNAVKDCKQVFVLTHSFEFLRLLLNWRHHAGRRTGYYMIRNQLLAGQRRAVIDKMDNELRSYISEYQYLFKQLKEMRAAQDGTLAQAYPVPNIARKVWETFLMYQVPNADSPYIKMDLLKQRGFDAQKLDAIYKYTNDQSHMTGGGFDPALVPETAKVLDQMFEMMQVIAPDHFSVLDTATAP